MLKTIGGTSISARFIGTDQFVLHVQGIADLVAEVAEQIVWLVGSLRQSTFEFCPVSCRPRIHEITTLATHFKVKIDFVLDRTFSGTKTSDDGHCWYNMFRNPVVVSGYPILRRPTNTHGLEIPLNLMAELIGGQRITDMMGNHYIKGLRSMLVVSGHVAGGIFNWHHLVNSNEHRISYSYGYRSQGNPVLASSSSLAAARHIVGWCPRVSYRAGECSRLNSVSRRGFLEFEYIFMIKFHDQGQFLTELI